MVIRDRIVELRRMPAAALRPHPKNWRRHPPHQVAALRAVLSEIGFAGAELAFPSDGKGSAGDFSVLTLIDGAARREIAGQELVPVLVTDLTATEADLMLATFDPIGAMAEADSTKLRELLEGVEISDASLKEMLGEMAAGNLEDGEVELHKIDIKPPPKMAWVLVGIPTVRFGEIAADVERIAALPEVIVETTANDGPANNGKRQN